MILSIKKKEHIVCDIRKKFSTALSVVVASMNGVKANTINTLRKDARSVGVYMQVVPNTLLFKAVSETPYECLSKIFVEQSIVAFSNRNPGDAARIFMKFSKENDYFKVKGAVFEGTFLGSDQISFLSSLPSFKESIVRLMFILQISSIGNLIRVLKKLSFRSI